MKKVKYISEAFSMQPEVLIVLTEEQYESYYNKPRACKEIKLEQIQGIHEEVPTAYYVGYNFEGNKIFQYLAKSVNVGFFE